MFVNTEIHAYSGLSHHCPDVHSRYGTLDPGRVVRRGTEKGRRKEEVKEEETGTTEEVSESL